MQKKKLQDKRPQIRKVQKSKAPQPKAHTIKPAATKKPKAAGIQPTVSQNTKLHKPTIPAEKATAKKISAINIPTKAECDEMMARWGMPERIMRHSLLVNKVSMFLARKLKDSGLKLNLQLVDKGSLLHDLDKLRTLKTDQHGTVEEEFLTNKGFPEVGKIANWHRFKFIKDDSLPWEAKIINYADKRVKHDKIVSLQDRFTDLLLRYDVKTPDHEAIQLFFQLEKEIFTRIRLDPDGLESYLK